MARPRMAWSRAVVSLLVVGQAGGVVVGGVVHAERMRLGGHQLGEFGFIAGKRFGHHHRHVVGRFGHDGADRGSNFDALARLQAQLGGRLRGGVLGHRHFGRKLDLARLQPLEQQIERHDLGQRSRMARAVGVARLHDGAGIGVHHDRGIGRIVAFGGGLAVLTVAGIGRAGGGRGGEHGRQSQEAPTATALDTGTTKRHSLSPTPFTGRTPKPPSWPIYSNLAAP